MLFLDSANGCRNCYVHDTRIAILMFVMQHWTQRHIVKPGVSPTHQNLTRRACLCGSKPCWRVGCVHSPLHSACGIQWGLSWWNTGTSFHLQHMHKGMSVGYPINASHFIKIQALCMHLLNPFYTAVCGTCHCNFSTVEWKLKSCKCLFWHHMDTNGKNWLYTHNKCCIPLGHCAHWRLVHNMTLVPA